MHVLTIRQAHINDISSIVKLDEKSYPGGGIKEKDLTRQLLSQKARLFIMEKGGLIIGFALLNMMKPGQIPDGFCDPELSEPIKDRWIYISAFTTESNYSDTKIDSQLAQHLEYYAKELGYRIFCIPLTEEHPYKSFPHSVFEFWEKRRYKIIGTIKWISHSGKKVCRFYKMEIDLTKDI